MQTALNEMIGRAIETRAAECAQLIVDEQWARNPSFQDRYGDAGHAKCVADVRYNLAYLAQALASDSPLLFADYIDWVSILFQGLKIPTGELSESLRITGEILARSIPESGGLVEPFVELGLKRLGVARPAAPSFIEDSSPLSGLAREYLDALRRGDRSEASRMVLDAVENGADVRDIYLQVFQPCQRELGRLWQVNQMTVATEHYCTAATQLIMSQLYPRIFSSVKTGRRLVAACVGNELHEIGLRMVADFFEMEGWDTWYLGSSMPASGIAQAARERKADVLAVSATMTYHVELVADLIRRVRREGGDGCPEILVGGYPFLIEPGLWRQVGADGCARDAPGAVVLADELIRT